MDLLKSKKFWTAVLGAVAVGVSAMFNVPEETIMTIGGIVIALLFGQGLADFGKEANKTDSK